MTDQLTPTAHTFVHDGTVTSPLGWRAAAVPCGIRYSRPDLALLVSDAPCSVAAMFTTNAVQSAHIHYDRPIIERNPDGMRAVVINSGIANACTGTVGIANAQHVAHALAAALGVDNDNVLMMSTGVIGSHLPVTKLVQGIAAGVPLLHERRGVEAARAIMTTDIYPKYGAMRVPLSNGGSITIGGMTKGSGMIHPNMATMLAVLTTDATLAPPVLRAALQYAVQRSYHCISVDGDTSTNDTALLLANGQAGQPAIDSLDSPDGQAFLAALTDLAQRLAQEVARDGEGATRLITVRITGATDDAAAHTAAMAVARSPLVKTAVFGADPNWGRVVCAIGYSGVPVDPERIVLDFGDVRVFANGVPTAFDEAAAHAHLKEPDVLIAADLGLGTGTATVWTCDFSYNYVKINAEYRS